MRKTGLIILTFLYLAFTAGISVQRHFCMNRMAALRFTTQPEERCGFCGMEKTERDNSCCHDEQVVYKITDDQQPGFPTLFTLNEFPVLLPEQRFSCSVNKSVVSDLLPASSHGPPGIPAVPLFIRFGIFRI
ncbi:MAG TPA: hypothetical protein PLL23_15780 [Chitinophagaceae bacterium]|nr:hypothetical protein [Chitinophagaceae bacterium]